MRILCTVLLGLSLGCVAPVPGEPHRRVPGLETPLPDSGLPHTDSGTDLDGSTPIDVPDAGRPPQDAGPLPSCGDGVCSGGETCGTCPRDCGSCCQVSGTLSCGNNGIIGDPNTLYRCDGTRYVKQEACGAACVQLPSGTPDRCPLAAPPASLVTRLSSPPYVEVGCVSATFPGWPYAAKRCTYSSGGITTSITVADPTAQQVAKWVVDASALIVRLRALQAAHATEWEQGLGAIAQHMLLQSSRIFALEGGIIENMGTGYVNYPFLNGVTQGCSSGCYCRINSLHRTTYCAWRGAKTNETEAACLARVGTSGLTTGWGKQCLQNHIDSWTRESNEHFRAMAWKANDAVLASCPATTSCTPAQVVTAVKSAYGL